MPSLRRHRFAAVLFCCLFLILESAPGFGADSQSGGVRSAESRPPLSVEPAPRRFKIRIVNEYPHDPDAFTEGLVFSKGFLYESTGLNGRSSLRKVELQTGRVVKEYDLPLRYFGEGLAVSGGALVQLTWKTGKGFVYNPETFAVEREFDYTGEGWGLTSDGSSLIMSNGTGELVFLDPRTFEKKYSLPVQDAGKPVRFLNELEYIKGEIYANIWQEDFIAVISPKTGQVTGWINIAPLRGRLPAGTKVDVLNGIAFDAERDRIFVTGKNWPRLFEIQITEDR